MSAALPLALPGRRFAALPYRYLVATAFVLALFVDVLDTTIVNVALPTLGRELGAANSDLEWVVTGYLLSQAVWIPASGWLGDRFGTKRVFLWALGLFVLASGLCGVAWSLESLTAFRVLQGIGGGMLVPVGTAMTFRAFPQAERARASAIMGIPVVVAPVLGPVLGGWLVDHAGWRWIFLVNLPLGLVGWIFAGLVLREHVAERPGRFDMWGFLLAGAGLPLVLFALSRAPLQGWGDPVVLVTGVGGVLCLAGLAAVEWRRPDPMLDLRLLGDGRFGGVTLAMVLTTAGLTGMLFLLQLFLQQVRGLPAQEAGLTSFPQAVGLVCAIPLAGWLYERVGARRLVVVGLSGATATAALFLLVDLTTNLWWIRGLLYARGIALGLALLPLQTAAFASIGSGETGVAAALFSSARHVASSLGVTLLATALVWHSDGRGRAAAGFDVAPAASLQGFQAAYAVATLLGLLSVAAALLIRGEETRPYQVTKV